MAVLSMWYTHTLVFLYFILGGSFILFGYKFIFACAILKSENSLMFGKTLTCSNTIYINEHDVFALWGFPDGSAGEEPAGQCRRHERYRFFSWENPLEWEMAVCSTILAWKIPWTGEPAGLQSMGSQRVRHDWVCECVRARARTHTHTQCINKKPHPVDPAEVWLHRSKHTHTWNIHLQPQLTT